MKKYYLINLTAAVILLMTIAANATIHTVTVANFSFSPSSMTVAVGDTVEWVWSNGSHTTTDTAIPNGAATWDAMINSSSTTFSYKVTVAGNYGYHCSFHSTLGMVAGFTAVSTAGISEVTTLPFFDWNIRNNLVTVKLNLTCSSPVKIKLFGILGNNPVTLSAIENVEGQYSETFSLNDFAKGVYLLQLLADDKIITRKLIVQ
jgi:plastocyanin